MKEAKRCSGPKITLGKVRSLRNVTSHGAALIGYGNTNEKDLFNSFAKALTNHYKPKSPME